MKEYQAKNLNDLLKQIAEKANCQVEDITYEIIEERKGILGIGNSVKIRAYTPNDIKEFIFEYLGNYFTELNQAVKIEITPVRDSLKVTLNAENNAVVIGKNGQTLQAINLVLKAACNTTFKKRINVFVDVNDYKEQRYQKLRSMARRIAKEVSRTMIDVELDPMGADERKIIHQYLTNFKNIKTESVDEGIKRHLVIKYVD